MPPVDVSVEAVVANPAPAALGANSAGPAARSDSAGDGGGGSASGIHRGVHASSKALQAGFQADLDAPSSTRISMTRLLSYGSELMASCDVTSSI